MCDIDQTSFRNREIKAYIITMMPYLQNKVGTVTKTSCFKVYLREFTVT